MLAEEYAEEEDSDDDGDADLKQMKDGGGCVIHEGRYIMEDG